MVDFSLSYIEIKSHQLQCQCGKQCCRIW